MENYNEKQVYTELDILRKNVRDLELQLRNANIRIWELNEIIFEKGWKKPDRMDK